MNKLYIFWLLAMSFFATAQNAAELDLTFSIPGAPANYWYFSHPEQGTFNETAKAALQPDGKIIVATGKGLDRINGNNRDLSFQTDFTANLTLPKFNKILLQPDGKLLVLGTFTKCDGVVVKNLVRLMPGGSLDLSFTLATDYANDVALQPDGKVLISYDGAIKRLNADGSLDGLFNYTEPEEYIIKFFLAPDGKIWYFANNAGQTRRVNANGTLDGTFQSQSLANANGSVLGFTFQPDGKAVCYGLFDPVAANTPNIVRFNSNGSVDLTFQPGSEFPGINNFSRITDVILLPGGDMLVSSDTFFSDNSAHTFNHIIRLGATGTLNLNYGTQDSIDASNGVEYMTLLPDGNVLAQSVALNSFDLQFDYYYKFNAESEAIDMTFNNGPGFSNKVRAIVPQPDGKMLVAGDFSNFSQSHRKYLIRLNADATIDTSFNAPDFNNTVYAMALQQDGKVIVVGLFTQATGTNVNLAVRLMADGSVDASFNQEMNQYPQHAIVTTIQPDGKILLGGTFNISKNGKTWKNFVRLNTDGTIDTSFITSTTTNTNQGFNATVRAITLQPDGKILVGGDFTHIASEFGGNNDKKIMRFNPDGTRDNTLGLYPFNNSINAIAVEAGGTILVGGRFTNGFGAYTDDYIARMTATGGTVTFLPEFKTNGEVTSILLQPDGKIILGGKFSNADNYYACKRILRYHPNGILDQDFNSGAGFNSDVLALALKGDGRILAGGAFTYYNGMPTRYMAMLAGDDFYVVRGNNKMDFGADGCQAGDPAYPFLKFEVSNGQTNIPNASGSYAFSMPQGSYTFTPVFENPTYFTVSPTNITVDFPSAANPTVQDFCVVPNGIHSDLEVTVLPVTVVRPGFDATYRVVYKNKGNQVESGVLTVNFDDARADFISAVPSAVTVPGNLTWNFANLYPGESRFATFVLNLNSPAETPAVNGGDLFDSSAAIASQADEMPSDNEFTLHQTVVNAFDPNDKTCLQGAVISADQVGGYVHYLIRFENTGTYAAQNITVRDVIDPTRFDISTLVPISGSHLFTTRIDGNVVEFVFENINLPFNNATNDGFVAFKIKTLPTLVNGDVMTNAASIFFDYNAPIVTAPAATVVGTLSTVDVSFDQWVSIYPNPANHTLNIYKKHDFAIRSVSVYNMLGQLVMAVIGQTESIDVSRLHSGTYIIGIRTDKGQTVQQFVKN